MKLIDKMRKNKKLILFIADIVFKIFINILTAFAIVCMGILIVSIVSGVVF